MAESEHGCVIGDYVTLALGAKINGNITIGNHVYIGSGATVAGNPATTLSQD